MRNIVQRHLTLVLPSLISLSRTIPLSLFSAFFALACGRLILHLTGAAFQVHALMCAAAVFMCARSARVCCHLSATPDALRSFVAINTLNPFPFGLQVVILLHPSLPSLACRCRPPLPPLHFRPATPIFAHAAAQSTASWSASTLPASSSSRALQGNDSPARWHCLFS